MMKNQLFFQKKYINFHRFISIIFMISIMLLAKPALSENSWQDMMNDSQVDSTISSESTHSTNNHWANANQEQSVSSTMNTPSVVDKFAEISVENNYILLENSIKGERVIGIDGMKPIGMGKKIGGSVYYTDQELDACYIKFCIASTTPVAECKKYSDLYSESDLEEFAEKCPDAIVRYTLDEFFRLLEKVQTAYPGLTTQEIVDSLLDMTNEGFLKGHHPNIVSIEAIGDLTQADIKKIRAILNSNSVIDQAGQKLDVKDFLAGISPQYRMKMPYYTTPYDPLTGMGSFHMPDPVKKYNYLPYVDSSSTQADWAGALDGHMIYQILAENPGLTITDGINQYMMNTCENSLSICNRYENGLAFMEEYPVSYSTEHRHQANNEAFMDGLNVSVDFTYGVYGYFRGIKRSDTYLENRMGLNGEEEQFRTEHIIIPVYHELLSQAAQNPGLAVSLAAPVFVDSVEENPAEFAGGMAASKGVSKLLPGLGLLLSLDSKKGNLFHEIDQAIYEIEEYVDVDPHDLDPLIELVVSEVIEELNKEDVNDDS